MYVNIKHISLLTCPSKFQNFKIFHFYSSISEYIFERFTNEPLTALTFTGARCSHNDPK